LEAFSKTGLIEIIVPVSAEVLGEKCFSECGSLSSVEMEVLHQSGWFGSDFG
jgi:hypothetical protein